MPAPRFFLPSGAQVELAGARAELDGCFAAELSDVKLRLRSRSGEALELGQLPLADFHTLRALLRRLGRIPEREVSVRCTNCDHEQRVEPSSRLELGPFRDDELDDPELDASFDFDRTCEIPELSSARLCPRTLAEAAPLHRACRADRPLRVTSAVVRAMGIVELGGETDSRRIARRLAEASDAAFDAVALLFEDAHYPPRLDVPHPCASCGATIWVPAPMSRELSLEPTGDAPRATAPPEAFMSPDDFEALVREEAPRAYAAAHAAKIDLLVIDGPAEVDDGGEPLLGCYRPPDPHALVPQPAEIRIFYRTFANMYEEDGTFDVREEIAETLRHELEHHSGHLAGEDPLGEEEDSEVEHAHVRRVGRAETRRRAVRALGGDFREFVAKTWFVWVLALAGALVALWSQSH